MDPPAQQGYTPAAHPLRYLARHAWWVTLGVLCLVGTNMMAQAIPWAVKLSVEAIAAADAASWTIYGPVLAVAGLALGQALIRIPSRIFIFNAAREAEYELRGELFTRLCQASSAFYRAQRVGDLMSRMTNDLASVRALFGPGVLHVANTVFAYAMALPLMIHIDPWITLWSLAPYPLLLVGARFFARGIYSRSQEMQVSLAAMTSTVHEDLAGVREVKLHGLEGLRSRRFTADSERYLQQAVRLASWRAGLIPFVGIGAGASLVIVLWMGGARVISGELTLGDLVALNLYVGLLAWPTMSIGWMLSLWQRGVASWHRLHEILGHHSPLEVWLGRSTAAEQAPSTLEIKVRGLTLELDGAPILRDVDLEIPQRTMCAVVGRVGCGKTTLVEALARLQEVPPGAVFIGGRDVTELDVAWVRGQIAYSPQSAFLFSRSIRDNIAYSLPDAESLSPGELERRIQAAVERAGLAPDVESFPEGLDTVVGERGLSLSGGQRQRVALARALVSDRPILILDDSLSSVDAETEKRILRGLRSVMQDRTVILISHRLSALQHADQVVVLEQGQVAEVGRHDDLLGAQTLYAELYQRQLLLDELEG
jgi:ATP-binding cassette, subfamily B, multidrug efflux pump